MQQRGAGLVEILAVPWCLQVAGSVTLRFNLWETVHIGGAANTWLNRQTGCMLLGSVANLEGPLRICIAVSPRHAVHAVHALLLLLCPSSWTV